MLSHGPADKPRPMNAEPSGNEERSAYRPLPSVDLPLLPEHRRAIRLRRVLLATLFGVITLGAIGVLAADRYWPELTARFNGEGFSIFGMSDSEPVAATESLTGTVAVAATDAGDLSSEALAKRDPQQSLKYTTPFGKSPSFHAALRNAGLNDAECLEIENALRHTLDFRRCLPTHRLVVERDENARLLRFEYHPSNSEFVKVIRDADQKMKAERVSFPIKKYRVVKAGLVETSLREGLESVVFMAGSLGPSSKRLKVASTLGRIRARVTFSASSSTRKKFVVSSTATGAFMRSTTTVHAEVNFAPTTTRSQGKRASFTIQLGAQCMADGSEHRCGTTVFHRALTHAVDIRSSSASFHIPALTTPLHSVPRSGLQPMA